jgi:hypothetical protein
MKPFTYAVLAGAYIVLVVGALQLITATTAVSRTLFVPIGVLGLFVLSVAVMGYLFLYEPLVLFSDGKRREGVTFFARTVGYFAALVALYLLALLLLLPRTTNAPRQVGDDSGISGTILLGPTCPVMREPPDPACADKPYQTTVTVTRAGSGDRIATTASDASGMFSIPLAPGDYAISATGGSPLPRCTSATVTVRAGSYATTTISCDTGIR